MTFVIMDIDIDDHINDCIHRVVGTQINDGLLAYYQANGAMSDDRNDAEHEFLLANGAAPADLNDMWFDFLTQQGMSGSLNGMLQQFWCKREGIIYSHALIGDKHPTTNWFGYSSDAVADPPAGVFGSFTDPVFTGIGTLTHFFAGAGTQTRLRFAEGDVSGGAPLIVVLHGLSVNMVYSSGTADYEIFDENFAAMIRDNLGVWLGVDISIGTMLDIDHDGKPDTTLAGTHKLPGHLTEDEDSYNLDTDGDGDADIIIPK